MLASELELNRSSHSIELPYANLPPETVAPIVAIILLNGAVGSSDLASTLGISPLDLPIGRDLTLMGLWRRRLAESKLLQTFRKASVRLVSSQRACAPEEISRQGLCALSCELDPIDLRGTGGVLRDVTTEYPDDALVLILAAAQILMQPLDWLIQQLSAPASDLSILAHGDGSPAFALLARCSCLRQIPSVGFVDLKEQALPKIALGASVSVSTQRRNVAASVRTAEQYISAVREFHQNNRSDSSTVSSLELDRPFTEDWRPRFQVVANGAVVHKSARLFDSVVLPGARVDRNAILVRTVVGAGACVPSGSIVADRVVRAGAM